MKRLIVATALCLALNVAPVAAEYATDMSAGGLLSATNSERAASGSGRVSIDSKLSQAAQARANDMVARDYWSHRSPEGWSATHFVDNEGYRYIAIGENLAFGQMTSSEAVAHWMTSTGHRNTMLRSDFEHVGFGIANSNEFTGTGRQTVVVAMFGDPVPSAPVQPPKPVEPQPEPAPAPEPVPAPEAEPVKSEEPQKKTSKLQIVGIVATAVVLIAATLGAAYIVTERYGNRS